jgi:hypothetical protein
MSQQYIDPRTGFIITSNADTWRTDHKALPESIEVETAPQKWGNVGQGATRSDGNPTVPTLEDLRDFRVWSANKQTIIDAANSGYYNN